MFDQDPRTGLIDQITRAYQVADRASATGILAYLQQLVIHSDPPRPFREKAEPWQWALVNKLVPAIEYAAQLRQVYDGPRRFWITLPKGHDKTSMIGRLLNWAIGYGRSHLTAYAAAKDRDQAGLLVDAMQIECTLNPWLKKRVTFKNWKVTGSCDSKLHVLAADAGGNQGIRGDLLVIDELSQWDDEQFFVTLVSGIGKRPRGILIILTNAGMMETWQWSALVTAKRLMKETGLWYVYEVPQGVRLASWMREEDIAQDRLLMPESQARMLFENEWIDPRSDCQYVSRDQVTRCEDPDLDCSPQSDLEYVASVDYGPVKDRTVVSLSTKRGDQVQIVQMRVWQGSKDRHVSIEEVESYLDQLLLTYPVRLLIFDKYQMEASIQKYQRRVDVEVFEPRGPSGNHAMAECLRNLIVNGKIKWRPDTGSLAVVDRMGRMKNQTFSDELVEVAVKLQPGGYRVTNLLPGTHDDRFCAAAMGILHTIRRAERCPIHINDLWF